MQLKRFHHINSLLKCALIILLIHFTISGFAQSDFQELFIWDEIEDLPFTPSIEKQSGIAYPFAGKSGNVLIVVVGYNIHDILFHLKGKNNVRIVPSFLLKTFILKVFSLFVIFITPKKAEILPTL